MRPGHPRPSSRSNAGRGETGGIIFAATDEKQNRNAMERIVEFETESTEIYTTNITDQSVFVARYTEKVASRMLGGCKMFKFFGTDQRLK